MASKRTHDWWPQFRVIDTATVTPDPEVAAAVARFEQTLIDKMSEAICVTTVALDSSTATVRTREAAIGNLFADAMRDGMHADAAMLNGGGIRAGKTYEAGARISAGRHPRRAAVQQPHRGGGDQRPRAEGARWRTGCRSCPRASGRFPQVSGIDGRSSISHAMPGSRVTAMQVAGAPLDESKTYRVAVLDFLARGGDDYIMFRDARRITPDNDAPLMVNEVVEYLRKLGTVRTGVEGRIAAK